MPHCNATTKTGKKCRNAAKQKYCHAHTKRRHVHSVSTCKDRLQRKIRININENRWPRKQAIAIAYSQVRKKYPACSRYLRS